MPCFHWHWFPLTLFWLASKFKLRHDFASLLSYLNHSQHWRQSYYLPALSCGKTSISLNIEMWPSYVFAFRSVFISLWLKGGQLILSLCFKDFCMWSKWIQLYWESCCKTGNPLDHWQFVFTDFIFLFFFSLLRFWQELKKPYIFLPRCLCYHCVSVFKGWAIFCYNHLFD